MTEHAIPQGVGFETFTDVVAGWANAGAAASRRTPKGVRDEPSGMKFEVDTPHETCVVDVTDDVEHVLPDDADGVCTVFVPHTTAGVVVNEPELGLLADIEGVLPRLVPDGDYEHDRIDDNAASHLRALVLGESVSIPVRDGSLALGTWQAVLFAECDGPRTRRVDVTVA